MAEVGKARPGAGDDFYVHVNHGWLSDPNVVIPDEYPRWGSFIELVDKSLKNQIGLLEELSEKVDKTPDEAKLALVWHASLKRFQDWEDGKGDYAAVDREFEELAAHLERGDEGLAQYLARCQEVGISAPFGFDKESNLEDSKNVVLDLSPSGMSLPSRDYYLDEKFAEKRTWFLAHLNKVRDMVGAEKLADGFAEAVMRFETKLAMISMKKDQSRQFDKYYTITTLDDVIAKSDELRSLDAKKENYAAHEATDDVDILCAESASLDDAEKERASHLLETMCKELNLRTVMAANFAENYPNGDKAAAQFRVMAFDGDYLRRVFKLLLREGNRADLTAYLQYKVIRSAASYCTKDLDEEVFDFYSRKLQGQNAQKSPEKRSVALINSWMGELLGKIYVSRYFSEDDKATVKGMIHEVLDIMIGSVMRTDWLTAPTKAKAKEKLEGTKMKIGYQDKWKDYSSLELLEEDDLFTLRQKVTAFDHRTELLAKINAPKDVTEWHMTPQTVNAYYSPLMNEIVFPAAIIQPPFYIQSADQIDFDLDDEEAACSPALLVDAVNFGGIGAVISHEITHGVDDNGKKFSADGNIENWWTDADDELFKAKVDVMKAQAEVWTFEAKSADDATGQSSHVHRLNGELTSGENLADLGGMSLGCQALSQRLEKAGLGATERKALLRVFFKSWANIWRSKETDEFTINQLSTDPHPPCCFRGNLVKNIDQFYEVFGVKEGDPMWLPKDKRVCMW